MFYYDWSWVSLGRLASQANYILNFNLLLFWEQKWVGPIEDKDIGNAKSVALKIILRHFISSSHRPNLKHPKTVSIKRFCLKISRFNVCCNWFWFLLSSYSASKRKTYSNWQTKRKINPMLFTLNKMNQLLNWFQIEKLNFLS